LPMFGLCTKFVSAECIGGDTTWLLIVVACAFIHQAQVAKKTRYNFAKDHSTSYQ
jgi:hypothetical protein